MRPPRTLAAASAATVGFVALVGGLFFVGADSAQAVLICSTSSLCESGNLPLLEEAGLMSGPPAGTALAVGGAATVATTAATGGVATLGGFAASLGVTGATTGFGAGTTAVLFAGLLAVGGMPDGVALQTSPGSGFPGKSAASTSCDGSECATVTGVSTAFPVGVGLSLDGLKVTDLSNSLCAQLTDEMLFLWTGSPTPSIAASGVNFCRQSVIASHGWSSAGGDGVLNLQNWDSSQTVRAITIAPRGTSASTLVYPGDPVSSPGGWFGTIRTTVTCTSPSGDSTVQNSAAIDLPSGSKLPVPSVDCPIGDLATSTQIDFAPTATPGVWSPLTTGAVPGTVKGFVTAYRDCFGPGVSPCTMQLQLMGGQGQWETCGPTAQYCPDWVTQAQAQPSMYRCQYGSYTLSFDHCSAFRSPGKLLPNYNPDSGTVKPITDPVPATLPNPVVDPSGAPADLPLSAPSDKAPSDCWPSGWGVFNPLAWVYQPLICAAEDLFIPKETTADELVKIRTRFDASVPGQVANALTGQVWPVIDAGGCSGFTISLAWMKQGAFVDAPFPASFQLLQACDGDVLHPWAVFANFVLTVGIVVAMFKTWPTLIGRVFNYGGIE